MAITELKTRLLINGRATTEWTALTNADGSTFIPMKNELCYDTTLKKMKIGDGVTTYAALPYLTYTEAEIKKFISDAAYVLPNATTTTKGGVIVGSNIDVSNGTISVKDATTGQKGVVQLTSATNSTSETLAATAKGVKTAYDKANAALPKAGGTMTGAITLSGAPTADLHAATKAYVDSQITSKLSASDAMVFKGTLGSNGTVTTLPTTGIVKGDTYKVITDGSYAGQTCKVGDLLIALNSGSLEATATNWAYVPSGNENETTIAISSSPNVNTTAKTGTVTLGAAAAKGVDTSMSTGTTSTNVPTSAAVSGAITGYAPSKTGANASGSWGISVTGNAATATKLATARTVGISGGATGTATSFDGSGNITIPVTALNTDYLRNGSNILVLNGTF